MARLSDLIEIFIKELLEDANNRTVEIQRNELANYFNCAPSQINYVLTTRFSVGKGYLIESRRGGGGNIKIVRIHSEQDKFMKVLMDEIGGAIGKMKAMSIINILKERGFITDRETSMMIGAISDRSIQTPVNIKDEVRANLLKSMIAAMFNYNGRG